MLGLVVILMMLSTGPASAVCSVLSGRPCLYRPFHQVCSVFHRHACTPELGFPFSQQLQLTVHSRDAREDEDAELPTAPEGPARPALRTIADVFDAVRACWIPPAKEHAQPGTELSIRLSFRRDGAVIGSPRLTYVTPGLDEETRDVYWEAVMAALHRCTPLSFSAASGVRWPDGRSPCVSWTTATAPDGP